jgi:hypothetical protein
MITANDLSPDVFPPMTSHKPQDFHALVMARHSFNSTFTMLPVLAMVPLHLRPTFRLLQHLPDASILNQDLIRTSKIHICIIPMANPANRIPCSTCLTNPPHCIARCRLCTRFIRYILYTPRRPQDIPLSLYLFLISCIHFPIPSICDGVWDTLQFQVCHIC